jgi:hypothetical protein
MDPFTMVVAIVFMSLVAGMVGKYLDARAQIVRTHGGDRDRTVSKAVEELRAEIAGMKQREAEAILTFDTTLQNLDTRLKHLEQGALTSGNAARSSLAGGETRAAGEPDQVRVSQAA